AARWPEDAAAAGIGPLVARPVPRATIHDDNVAHILCKHATYDLCNCRFLIKACDDGRDNSRATGRGRRRIALARRVAHRLQRSPQLAQAAEGLSESRALRNCRYACPFQMSRKL